MDPIPEHIPGTHIWLILCRILVVHEPFLEILHERITQVVGCWFIVIPDPNVFRLDHVFDIFEARCGVPAVLGLGCGVSLLLGRAKEKDRDLRRNNRYEVWDHVCTS